MKFMMNIWNLMTILIWVEYISSQKDFRLQSDDRPPNADLEQPILKEATDAKDTVIIAASCSLGFAMVAVIVLFVILCWRRKAWTFRMQEPVQEIKDLELKEFICQEQLESGPDLVQPLIEDVAKATSVTVPHA